MVLCSKMKLYRSCPRDRSSRLYTPAGMGKVRLDKVMIDKVRLDKVRLDKVKLDKIMLE